MQAFVRQPPTEQDIDRMAGEIARGQTDSVRRHFLSEGRGAPRLVWSPSARDLSTPLARQFRDAMERLCDLPGRVPRAAVTPEIAAPFQEWFAQVTPAGDGSFDYHRYGDGVANVRGISMRGKNTRDFDAHTSLFFTAAYRAVMARQDWLLSVHEPEQRIFAGSWERLIVPLFDPGGEAPSAMAVALVPDNPLRPGLEIIPDPVLIADDSLVVRFANRAAREFFGRERYLVGETDLFTFSGLDLTPHLTAHEMARTGAIHDTVSLAVRGGLIEHFLVTLSATEQWGTSFYVISLRLQPEARASG